MVDDAVTDGSGRAEPGEPLNPHEPRTVGPYALISRLGVGGMGTVYLARNRSGRLVAVKVIRPDLAADEEFRRRFRAEVEAARKVAPFCTAEVLDADPNAAAPYLVTEFIDGVRLDTQVEKGPLPGSTLTGLAVGVATALTAIHSAGLVHRDLKPSNVMLSLSGPRVIDFGIAQALEGAKARPTAWGFGSAGWMAPEQVHGQPIGPEADVFAWGILIAYAGTGRHPFGEGSDIDLGMRIVGSAPDLRGLPTPLVELVGEALAKHPDARPSARDLLLHLIAQPPSRAGTATAGAFGQAMGQAEELLNRTGEVPRPAPTRVGPVTSAPPADPRWGAGGPGARPGPPAGAGPPRMPNRPGNRGAHPSAPIAAGVRPERRGQPGMGQPGMGQPPVRGAMAPPGPRPAPGGGRPGGLWPEPSAGQRGPAPGPPSQAGGSYRPYPYPPARRRGPGLKRLAWIVGVLAAAIIAIWLVVSLPGKNGGDTTGSAAGSTAPTAPSPTPTATRTPAGLDRPATDGQLEFVVDNVDCGRPQLGDGILAQHADGQFCLAHMTVRNTGNSTRALDNGAQYLQDDHGDRPVSASFLARFAVDGDLWDSIDPGETKRGTMVFDIPKGANARELELHESQGSPGVRIPVA